MLYKRNIDEVLSRLTRLYQRKMQDEICVNMHVINPGLLAYLAQNEDGDTGYPSIQERLLFWDSVGKHYEHLEDDSIPHAYFSEFDEGLYAGLVGAEVAFLNNKESGWISSMAIPFVENLEDALSFSLTALDETWNQRFISQLKVFASYFEGKMGVSHFIVIDALNFLFELRGATNTYYDVMENPEVANHVMDFATQLCLYVQNAYFDTVGLYRGGTVSNLMGWCTGKIISESLDPYHLGSSDWFLTYGKAHVNKIVSHYDGMVIHLHTNGYHLLKEVVKLDKLKAVYFLDDDYNRMAFDRLDEILPYREDVPIILTLPYERFIQAFEENTLPTNALINVMNVPSIEEANAWMAKVKTYRKKG